MLYKNVNIHWKRPFYSSISIHIFRYFIFYFIDIHTDKIATTKDKDANQQLINLANQLKNQNASVQIPYNPSSAHNLLPHASRTPQPKIDATERRQVEAQNEDKSHTTKETLDDIKRIHHKEKKKKENNDAEQSLSGIFSERLVRKACIGHRYSIIYISDLHQFNLRYIVIYMYFSPSTAQKMRIRLLGTQT